MMHLLAALTNLEGHPLFPRPENQTGPDQRRFDIIRITRYLEDGTKEVCPKAWKGSELRSWGQVLDYYGGGCTYQLRAQCGRTHLFQAFSAKVYFSSPPPKPFWDDPEEKLEPACGSHPLFPDATPLAELRILVLRRRPDHSWEACPEPWSGSELRSWLQILFAYGGRSTYRLIAECADTGRFEAWTEHTFPAGPPRRSFRTKKR